MTMSNGKNTWQPNSGCIHPLLFGASHEEWSMCYYQVFIFANMIAIKLTHIFVHAICPKLWLPLMSMLSVATIESVRVDLLN